MDFLMIWCLLVLLDTAEVIIAAGGTPDPYETTTEHLDFSKEQSTFSTDSVTFASITDRSFITDSVESTTTAEPGPDGEPEFVSMGSLNLASMDVDHHCSNYDSNYRALFLYNITEDLVHVHKFLNSSYYGVEFWTDLVITNTTTMISNVTGQLFPKDSLISENGNGKCVTMKGESGRIFQKAKGCDSYYFVMCRIYTPNAGGGGSSSLNCICNCNNGDTHSTLTEDEVEIVLSEIRKNLTVFKANLSSSIRKRISATDPRMSSRVIGMTLGVSILSFVAGLLVIPDLVAGFRCLISMF